MFGVSASEIGPSHRLVYIMLTAYTHGKRFFLSFQSSEFRVFGYIFANLVGIIWIQDQVRCCWTWAEREEGFLAQLATTLWARTFHFLVATFAPKTFRFVLSKRERCRKSNRSSVWKCELKRNSVRLFSRKSTVAFRIPFVFGFFCFVFFFLSDRTPLVSFCVCAGVSLCALVCRMSFRFDQSASPPKRSLPPMRVFAFRIVRVCFECVTPKTPRTNRLADE